MKDGIIHKIVKFSPAIMSILTVVVSVIYFAASLASEVKGIAAGLNEEQVAVKAYVDATDKTIDERIDELSRSIEKTSSEAIMRSQEVNNRLDKIWVVLSDKNDQG